MKRLLFLFATTFAAMSINLSVSAQNAPSSTTIYIDITVDRQEVIAGPYARYAQKYLGVSAPLTDKVLHEITDAKIADSRELSITTSLPETFTPPTSESHMNPAGGFQKLPIDKTSNTPQSIEESARLAAEKIFEIRRSRFDLITGDIGENVFGAGLGDALHELQRLEEEYLSLFLGKQTNSREFGSFQITPTRGQSNYTVCRLSETDGLLPDDDLSGDPVLLELRSATGTNQTTVIQSKPSSRAIPQFIPADTRCRIIFDGTEIASKVIPIQQLGETIYVMP